MRGSSEGHVHVTWSCQSLSRGGYRSTHTRGIASSAAGYWKSRDVHRTILDPPFCPSILINTISNIPDLLVDESKVRFWYSNYRWLIVLIVKPSTT